MSFLDIKILSHILAREFESPAQHSNINSCIGIHLGHLFVQTMGDNRYFLELHLVDKSTVMKYFTVPLIEILGYSDTNEILAV